jgi:hypothetical protein
VYSPSSTPYSKVIEHQALSHEAVDDYDEAIVVAGSRKYNDYEKFKELLEEWIILEFPKASIIFISGKAVTGPDDMIIRWCRENGRAWTEYPADWDDLGAPGAYIKRNARGKLYNAAAGHQRNAQMADVMTHALIFWDGHSPGTKNMINEAVKREIPHKVLMIDGDRDKRKWGNEDGRQELWGS